MAPMEQPVVIHDTRKLCSQRTQGMLLPRLATSPCRTYDILVQVQDVVGNITSGAVSVWVPHDQSCNHRRTGTMLQLNPSCPVSLTRRRAPNGQSPFSGLSSLVAER
jgi:hypothetical protein